MPKHLRLLLDECVSSPRVLETIRAILAIDPEDHPPQLVFLEDFMGRVGYKDREWIPAARSEGFDIVLTGDKGRGKRGDKLPEICAVHGLRHLIIRERIIHRGFRFLLHAIIGAWPHIVEACAEDGLRYQLQLLTVRGKHEVGTVRVALSRVRLNPPTTPPAS